MLPRGGHNPEGLPSVIQRQFAFVWLREVDHLIEGLGLTRYDALHEFHMGEWFLYPMARRMSSSGV